MYYPIFLSVVFVIRNQADQIKNILLESTACLASLVNDYELIIIDNASNDNSLAVLKELTEAQGLPNLQIYALTKEVDEDTASWVGLENALGDFIVAIDPMTDDISFLPTMLETAASGVDVVFAYNLKKPAQSFAYRSANAIFNRLYKKCNGINLFKDAPKYRVLSKRVINFILQHPQPAVTYRHLPATGGFAHARLTYSAKPKTKHTKCLAESMDRGIKLLVSTTRGPMRIVTTLCMFGALSNLAYFIYVIAVGFLKTDVQAGWISLSLQQSGMFFLISLVLLVLGEYILQMANLSNEGPLYHIGQEFTSVRMTRRERLNIEEVMPPQRLRAIDNTSNKAA